MFKNLNIKCEKSKNEIKFKDIVITNANSAFEILILKTHGCLLSIGCGQ